MRLWPWRRRAGSSPASVRRDAWHTPSAFTADPDIDAVVHAFIEDDLEMRRALA
jgi:hypothetical protein